MTLVPLLVDTGALLARFNTSDEYHEPAVETFDRIRSGDQFGRLHTSDYVLDELTTLLRRKVNHATASRASDAVLESDSIRVHWIGEDRFAAARESFDRFDDQAISFTDHTTAVLANEQDVNHVFAFDDDFETLGLDVVP